MEDGCGPSGTKVSLSKELAPRAAICHQFISALKAAITNARKQKMRERQRRLSSTGGLLSLSWFLKSSHA